MTFYKIFPIIFLVAALFTSCRQKDMTSDMNILFLHHSTGSAIWQGSKMTLVKRAARKLHPGLEYVVGKNARLPELFEQNNKETNKNYLIKEMIFPKHSPYGWHNYPYDYYDIWVKNAGEEPYMEEPTLEMLTKQYQFIIFKHCFPVSSIKPDLESADINSDYKSISNYKLQYTALRNKLLEFPNTKFLIFTGAVHVKANINEDQAIRAKEFFNWVTNEWDVPGDNIYLWDFYNLETEGGLYLKGEYAVSPANSHPNGEFSAKAVKLLFNRIIDVIENDGKRTKLTGELF